MCTTTANDRHAARYYYWRYRLWVMGPLIWPGELNKTANTARCGLDVSSKMKQSIMTDKREITATECDVTASQIDKR